MLFICNKCSVMVLKPTGNLNLMKLSGSDSAGLLVLAAGEHLQTP